MKRTDKFLIGLVVGIILLVVAAFIIVLSRPEPTYQSEDTATGVAHNYLLALQQKQYERAYGYLSPTLKGYPESVDVFIETIRDQPWHFRADEEASLAIESEQAVGSRIEVTVRESRFYGGGLFSSGQSYDVFTMKLQSDFDNWRIVAGDFYFARCWDQDDGCE